MKSGKIIALFILLGTLPAQAQDAPPPPAAEAPITNAPVIPAAVPTPAPASEPTAMVPKSGLEEKFGTPGSGPSLPAPTGTLAPNAPPSAGAANDLVYLNATDVDIKDMIKQISKATGTNFLIDDKTRGKITIISEKPMTKEMAYQAFLSALEVMGYTTVATPAGLVKIVATKDAISEPLDIYKSDIPNTDRFITRIIQVVNISANDLASVVKTLISKEGNLFAYPATNSLIMTDTGSNIDRILKIIKELDQEGPQEVIEIIPILNADASDVTEKVLDLFQDEGAGGKGGGARKPGRGGGAELDEIPSISKVISDERTNSVIVLGTKRAILKVRSLIARLDSPATGVEGTIHVHYLKNATAKEVAEVLSNLVSDGGGGDKKGGEIKKGAVHLEGGVKVSADEGTNALVITASPKDFQTLVDSVISKLDIPRRQVYLEAVVMELTVNKTRSLGLGGNFANVLDIAGEKMGAFGAQLPLTPSAISSIAGAAGGLGAGFASERTFDFTMKDGSTVSIPAVSAILQALETDTDVNILSTPSILTMDNEEAQIQIGSEVPTPSGTTVSSGVTTFNVTREDTGIILKITPQISESDTVRLKLTQEISAVTALDPALGPTLSKRSVQTVVVANDKQTIVIGGLIDDHATVTTNKIPFLGDVPVIGNLFKNRSNVKTKTNIIVFITPYVIRDRQDYMAILQKKIEERNLFIDLNYGTGQKKQIRQSIRNHAGALLEYKSVMNDSQAAPSVVDTPVTPPTPAPTLETAPAEAPAPTEAPAAAAEPESAPDAYGSPSRHVKSRSKSK